MSYVINRTPDAGRRNGILGHTHHYLNTLGDWQTYRNAGSAEDIVARVVEVTAAYFGLKGLTGGSQLHVSGLLGAVVLIHALEQLTGGIATTGMRLYARGRPLASYRGITIHESPFTPQAAHLLDRVTRGRLVAADGYYFFEGGKTWHGQSLTLPVGDELRTLTRLQSFCLPQREFFFDRPIHVPGSREPAAGERGIAVQRIIGLVKGDEAPDQIPGFIGGINELEGLTMLRPIKYLLFIAQWLLIDPAERDNDSRPVDYESLVKGPVPGAGSSGFSQPTRPAGAPVADAWWPSTSRTTPLRSPASPPPSPPPPPPFEANWLETRPAAGPINGQAGPATPASQYKDRIRIEGRDYPLVIKRVVTSPINGGKRKVDAVYYDDLTGQWREIIDEETRSTLARAVEAGLVTVVDPRYWPTA